jgi:hypothetical protein
MEIERGGLMTVTFADAVFVGSVAEVAVTVTWSGRLLVGAVYIVEAPLAVEVGETDPHDDVEQDTFHVTPRLLESFATVAVMVFVLPACKLADRGETLTLIARRSVDPHP